MQVTVQQQWHLPLHTYTYLHYLRPLQVPQRHLHLLQVPQLLLKVKVCHLYMYCIAGWFNGILFWRLAIKGTKLPIIIIKMSMWCMSLWDCQINWENHQNSPKWPTIQLLFLLYYNHANYWRWDWMSSYIVDCLFWWHSCQYWRVFIIFLNACLWLHTHTLSINYLLLHIIGYITIIEIVSPIIFVSVIIISSAVFVICFLLVWKKKRSSQISFRRLSVQVDDDDNADLWVNIMYFYCRLIISNHS